ncbi:MAG: hypothetical protein IJ461_03130 [Clostridia bacterium]|nr:hypothetical protein [Clostridia bacterium]
MSLGKMAVAGMAGFALGAGMMLSPNAPKWKRAIIKEANMIKKAVERW